MLFYERADELEPIDQLRQVSQPAADASTSAPASVAASEAASGPAGEPGKESVSAASTAAPSEPIFSRLVDVSSACGTLNVSQCESFPPSHKSVVGIVLHTLPVLPETLHAKCTSPLERSAPSAAALQRSWRGFSASREDSRSPRCGRPKPVLSPCARSGILLPISAGRRPQREPFRCGIKPFITLKPQNMTQ